MNLRVALGKMSILGPLAQLVEQGTLNPKVVGSIPTRPIFKPPLHVMVRVSQMLGQSTQWLLCGLM